MVQNERVTSLNSSPVRSRGRYVLYWMQAAQRAEYNHALEFAIEQANALKQPVVAVFGLSEHYPQANLRHYRFMLEGLAETQAALAERNIQLVILRGQPDRACIALAPDASVAIVDAGHLRVHRKWRTAAARKVACALFEVETNLIVPVTEASDKEEFSAATFRPKIRQKLGYYLRKLPQKTPGARLFRPDCDSFDITDIDNALAKLRIDRSVGPVDCFRGGTGQARKLLRTFITDKLSRYAAEHNDPNAECVSHLSPYLHSGQISPLQIAMEVLKADAADTDAFLEELIVRRELSYNFVYHNRRYDVYDCLPAWARRTLDFHRRDRREYIYSLADFENSLTHDVYWNAAQKEMVLTGKMHGYMRMYWGKKILEWCRTPRQAFSIALYLNNKYELDGRDPNGFAGVAWCFGKHDRPWGERAISGTVRYMNDAGLKRKFDADRYVERIGRLEKSV